MKIKNTIASYYNNPKKALLHSVTCFGLMIILVFLSAGFIDFTQNCVDVDKTATRADMQGKWEVPITSECTSIAGTTYYSYEEREYSEPSTITYLFWSILWIQIFISIILLLLSITGRINQSAKNAKKAFNELKIKKKEERALNLRKEAKERETAKDYDSAIKIWEELGEIKEAARVRKLKAKQGAVKVTQKVVHGDEVTKTEIKDSVLNRSNVGSGGDDKFTKLKELKEMLSEGLIDDAEFKQMKKEILGK